MSKILKYLIDKIVLKNQTTEPEENLSSIIQEPITEPPVKKYTTTDVKNFKKCSS
jgi:hypothetical protein